MEKTSCQLSISFDRTVNHGTYPTTHVSDIITLSSHGSVSTVLLTNAYILPFVNVSYQNNVQNVSRSEAVFIELA